METIAKGPIRALINKKKKTNIQLKRSSFSLGLITIKTLLSNDRSLRRGQKASHLIDFHWKSLVSTYALLCGIIAYNKPRRPLALKW